MDVVTNLSRTGSHHEVADIYSNWYNSSAVTETLLKSSSEIILWHLKENVDTENYCLNMVSLDKEEDKQPEHERKDKAQRACTHWNPKRHIPLVSLLLWHKMAFGL